LIGCTISRNGLDNLLELSVAKFQSEFIRWLAED
jgi:hypothetical protein